MLLREMELRSLFHKLWTESYGLEHYDKRLWMDLETLLFYSFNRSNNIGIEHDFSLYSEEYHEERHWDIAMGIFNRLSKTFEKYSAYEDEWHILWDAIDQGSKNEPITLEQAILGNMMSNFHRKIHREAAEHLDQQLRLEKFAKKTIPIILLLILGAAIFYYLI